MSEELQKLYNKFVNNKLNEECEYQDKYENMFTLSWYSHSSFNLLNEEFKSNRY